MTARRTDSRIVFLTALMLGVFFGAAPAFAATSTGLVTVNTRPGVTQKFVLIKPDNPVASVILFAGGAGFLNLSQNASGSPVIGAMNGNFLVRTRQDFVNHGFMVAVVDAPSDRQNANGMLGGFRAGAEHAVDIAAVVAYLRAQVSLPVWLVGTSRGTESAANNAIRLTEGIGGLVLTSSMTVANSNGIDVLSMNLAASRVPVFVMAHDQDQCSVTPPAGAQSIVSRLTGAPVTGLALLTGGLPPAVSDPCEALTRHGYYGIESQAVDAIEVFIKAHSPYSISASGSASGPLTARVLAVTVKPAVAELATTRQVFVAAILGAQLYFRTPAGWTPWSSGNFPAYSSGAFAAQTINVFDGSLDLSGAAGAQIYVGYGADSSETLTSGRFARVHTLQ